MIHPDRRNNWTGAKLVGSWIALIVIPAGLCVLAAWALSERLR